MRVIAIIGFLLFLLACSNAGEGGNATEETNATNATPISLRDPSVCPQIQSEPGHLNFVFVFHNLQENTSDHYYAQAVEHLRSVEPFSNTPFNAYRIELDRTLCWPKGDKTIVRSQLTCDWEIVNEKLISCWTPNQKVIFISGDDVQTTSVPAYYKSSFAVIDEQEFTRYFFLHEVGHLFGLQEEYLNIKTRPGTISWQPRKPNCAQNMSEAKEWWGADVGLEGTAYYEGCAGHLNYFRPNKETLMGDKASADADYGYVSTEYLEDALNCCYAANREQHSCDGFFEEFPEWADCRD